MNGAEHELPDRPGGAGNPLRPRDGSAVPPPARETSRAGEIGSMGPSSWIERQIREATERGEFDNLPGAGKPLDLADVNDPDWWIKAKMARENIETADLVPPVIALRRQAQSYPESLADLSREQDVREVLRDYNRRVVDDIRRPRVGPTLPVVAPRIDVDAMVERWRELRAQMRSEASSQAAPPLADPSRPRRPSWWPMRRRRGGPPGWPGLTSAVGGTSGSGTTLPRARRTNENTGGTP